MKFNSEISENHSVSSFDGKIFNLNENIIFSITKLINKFRNTLASGKIKLMPDTAARMNIMVIF